MEVAKLCRCALFPRVPLRVWGVGHPPEYERSARPRQSRHSFPIRSHHHYCLWVFIEQDSMARLAGL